MTGRLLSVYVDASAAKRLAAIAEELGRDIEELAACSVEEAALIYFKHRKDDPAKGGDA
ncbi:hypothetical protein OLZ32_27995 [Rhizobium sp. 1AS11]|uniref:hypothetical protein n=1 Tax=Rhizobium acaciae TaxID=2989736 RepID=UPI0022214207|nr:hypothetical protein [Rhizobium acaciae]MCW1412196.1 hypothetical protein [Rhizobium acaciae]MCW1744211.1 hypothetical protein [Rhizobium acaciae]